MPCRECSGPSTAAHPDPAVRAAPAACTGFALENNPDDVLMVACPVPSPAEWDDRFRVGL